MAAAVARDRVEDAVPERALDRAGDDLGAVAWAEPHPQPDLVARLGQEPTDSKADHRQPVLVDVVATQVLAERFGYAVERVRPDRLVGVDWPLAVAVVHAHHVVGRGE